MTLLGLPIAQADDQTERARAHLERAKIYYAEGDYAQAAGEFEATLKLQAAPALYFNLGQARRLLGEFALAVEAYSRFASEKQIQPALLEVTRRHIAELRPYVIVNNALPQRDRVVPSLRHSPRVSWFAGEALPVEVIIEDRSGVFQPTLFHRLAGAATYLSTALQKVAANRFAGTISAENGSAVEYYLEAFDAEGNGPSRHGTPSLPHRVALEVRLTPAAPTSVLVASVPVVPVTSASPEPLPEIRFPSAYAYAALAGGVVAAAIGTGFGVQASEAASDWRSAASSQSWDDGRARTVAAASRANVSWTAAGILFAGGGGLLWASEF